MLSALAAAPVAAQTLDREIATALSSAHLGSSVAGVSIVDVATGLPLAGLRDDQRLIPASNLKLFTSATALAVLGPDFEFRTRLCRHGSMLVVEASGDPAFADPKLLREMRTSLDAFVDRLARSVAEAVPPALSEIVIDDRVFDRDPVNPDWPPDQLDKWYCAEVRGLNFHANVMTVFAAPALKDGELATVRTEPAHPAVEIENRLRTAAAGTTLVGITRDADRNSFRVRGTVRAALDEPAEVTMHNAGLVFGRMLSARLAELGVNAPPRAGPPLPIPVRLVDPDERLGQADDVYAVVRTPLSVVLSRCNVDSHNLYAECLLKRIGHESTGQPGSWANGAAAVRMQLRDRLGPQAAAAVFLADGSGLARANRVSPSVLARWLAAVACDDRIGPPFIDSLARARKDGTLARRFEGKKFATEIRAKSGLINGVRTLSGYVQHPTTGRRIAFAILVNDITVPATRVRDFHEEIVLLIDRYLTRLDGPPTKEAFGG